MSANTLNAVDDAIRAHIADENDGATVTGWLVSVAHVTAENLTDGVTGLRGIVPEGQPFHVSVGLAEVARMLQRDNWHED